MFGAFPRSYFRRRFDLEGRFSGDYYDPAQLWRFARQKAERLKAVGLVDFPAIVHLETPAALQCGLQLLSVSDARTQGCAQVRRLDRQGY
jgi:hypothetical protein